MTKGFISLAKFCDGYGRERVTPYMYIMAFHVPYFMQYDNIKLFSCQGKNACIIKSSFITIILHCIYSK